MAKALHVTDFLWEPDKYPPKPVCVMFGDEAFLKSQALRHIRADVLDEEDAEFSFTRFEGDSSKWITVLEELSTVAMFGGGVRLVVLEDADAFVAKHRPELEDYLAKPSKTAILLILVRTFPSTTLLYKAIEKSGLLIDCRALAEKDVAHWLLRWGKQSHKISIEPAAADLLVELVGPELGLLDQELAKLALMNPPGKPITAKTVEQGVGTWRTRSVYEMLDNALSGNVKEAFRQLEALFLAGENPVGILAQISFSLRKLAAATQLILQSERSGSKLGVPTALEQVGTNRYFLRKTEQQLMALGRFRAQKLMDQLLQADLDLKGASRSDPRLILERFIIRISAPQLKLSLPRK